MAMAFRCCVHVVKVRNAQLVLHLVLAGTTPSAAFLNFSCLINERKRLRSYAVGRLLVFARLHLTFLLSGAVSPVLVCPIASQ